MSKELINKGDFSNYTPLHLVFGNENDDDDYETMAKYNTIKIATMLINDKRTDINAVDKDGETPLMVAIQSKYALEYASILIENNKCDVNAQDKNGETALHKFVIIAENTDYYCQLAEKLLQRKDLDCNITNIKGQTALDWAKEDNLNKIAKIFIARQKKCVNNS